MNVRLVKANTMGKYLDNAIAAAIRCAVLGRDLDALLESLEAGEEFGSVVVLVLVEAGRKRAYIKVALDRNLCKNTLSGRNVNGDAESLALLGGSVASKERSSEYFHGRCHCDRHNGVRVTGVRWMEQTFNSGLIKQYCRQRRIIIHISQVLIVKIAAANCNTTQAWARRRLLRTVKACQSRVRWVLRLVKASFEIRTQLKLLWLSAQHCSPDSMQQFCRRLCNQPSTCQALPKAVLLISS
mgnify:CR=1 FL=1